MALRLGEMLVKAGRIKPAQLDEALKSQVIFGGRLGTNLIEMGCIDEEELARVLSEKLRVPCVDPDELMNINPSVLELVPAEVVEQYHVIPFRLENRRLYLVMADPSDLAAIDQIAFRTGFVIVPMVAPEIRLMMALEKYFGIARKLRYIPVSKELGGRRSHAYESKSADAAKTAPRPVVDFSEIPGDGEEFFPWGGAPGVKDRIDAAQRYTIDTLSRALADAPDRNAVATALVEYLGQEFDRAALLLVTRDVVAGWAAVGGRKPVHRFEELRIRFDETSIMQTVVRGKMAYRGGVPATAANMRLLAALGGGEPEGVLLVPMVMNNRVVTILCVAGKLDHLGARLDALQGIARKVVLAFEVLILKNKILMT